MDSKYACYEKINQNQSGSKILLYGFTFCRQQPCIVPLIKKLALGEQKAYNPYYAEKTHHESGIIDLLRKLMPRQSLRSSILSKTSK